MTRLPDKTADNKPTKLELSSSETSITESSNYNQFLNGIALNLFTFLKIILFVLVLLAVIFISIKIYTQQGVVIQPFEVSKNEILGSITISDQITAELQRIQQIHSAGHMDESFSGNQTLFVAEIDAGLSPDVNSEIVPERERIEFSLAETGTINLGFGPLDPGKLIIAFKSICPGSKTDTTIRGSLQRYGSNMVLVAVMEGKNVQSWIVRQHVDNDSEEQFHEMIRNLSYMIAHDLPQSKVSAKTWEGLKYYTEALDAYHQYKFTGNLEELSRAGNFSLDAIRSEKGYRNPFDLLNAVELAYVSIGQKGKAIEYCNETIKLDPNSASGWENKGLVLFQLDNFSQAVKAYDNAIDINPRYAYAWNNKGLALDAQGKYEAAIKSYDRAIKIDPRYVDAWNNKGQALDAQGNYDEAIKACDKAIEINPKSADSWTNRGVALYGLVKYDEAIKAYDEAIRLDPQCAEAWYCKGSALLDQGKNDEAIQAYNMAIEINPKYAEAWNYEGWALEGLGKYDEAIQAYDEAIEINPKYAEAWNNKGLALEAKRESDADI